MDNMEHLGDFAVTLCEESVDWNLGRYNTRYRMRQVTLCEESVDWNISFSLSVNCSNMSLSARRVWIEIRALIFSSRRIAGHSLRGECGLKWEYYGIENPKNKVTLCEESVDWNSDTQQMWWIKYSHSLRGECGLKLVMASPPSALRWSLSARRVWIEIPLRSRN